MTTATAHPARADRHNVRLEGEPAHACRLLDRRRRLVGAPCRLHHVACRDEEPGANSVVPHRPAHGTVGHSHRRLCVGDQGRRRPSASPGLVGCTHRTSKVSTRRALGRTATMRLNSIATALALAFAGPVGAVGIVHTYNGSDLACASDWGFNCDLGPTIPGYSGFTVETYGKTFRQARKGGVRSGGGGFQHEAQRFKRTGFRRPCQAPTGTPRPGIGRRGICAG